MRRGREGDEQSKSAASFLGSLKSRRADACALAVVAIFFVVFFGWLLLPDGAYPVMGDSYFYSYPLRSEAWAMIRAGRAPLWTPHVFAGYPLLSMAQLGLAYPLTWGHLFLPPYVAETIYILAPFLLAPAFTYFYARQIGRSRAASLLAALAFGWGGGVANGLAHSGMLTNAVMWLPLFLVAVERARTRPFAGCLMGATAAYTLCVLNGHGQGFAYVGALALCYAAFVSLSLGRGRAGWARWRPLAVAAGALAFSAGLCAFQIMETMRAVRRSVRSVLSYESFTQGSFTPAQILHSLALLVFGEGDVSTYVAPLAFLLALAGAWLALRRGARREDARPAFWSAAAVASFVLMLGNNTPLYRIVYYVPVINRFRVPVRHSFEWTFAVAVLAAYGFDLLGAKLAARSAAATTRAQNLRRAGAVLSLALCLLVGLCWRSAALAGSATPASWTSLPEGRFAIWKACFTALACAAVWLSARVRGARWRGVALAFALALTFFFEPFISYGLWWRYTRKSPAHFSSPAAATLFMRAHDAEENRLYTRVPLFADETLSPARLTAPNLAAADGLREVAGYEPLTLTRYSRAVLEDYPDTGGATPRPDPAPDPSIFGERSHVLDLLNATYVASFAGSDDEEIKNLAHAVESGKTARWERAYQSGDGLVIFRNLRALPRAWLVTEAESVDGETALRRVRGGGPVFDPLRTALLEDAPGELPQLPGGEDAPESSARVLAYEPSRIVVETSGQTPTLLVVSEMFYPGWEASVDGRAERIHLADYLLRAVAVPAGRHRVEMQYHSSQARNGVVVSSLTLLLLAGIAFVSRRRRKTRGES